MTNQDIYSTPTNDIPSVNTRDLHFSRLETYQLLYELFLIRTNRISIHSFSRGKRSNVSTGADQCHNTTMTKIRAQGGKMIVASFSRDRHARYITWPETNGHLSQIYLRNDRRFPNYFESPSTRTKSIFYYHIQRKSINDIICWSIRADERSRPRVCKDKNGTLEIYWQELLDR